MRGNTPIKETPARRLDAGKNEMETLPANYINGNLTDAKRQAKRFNLVRLVNGLQEVGGYNLEVAHKIAQFLKGYGTFQAARDAEQAAKEAR